MTAGSHSGNTQPKYSDGTLFHGFSKELFFLLFYMMFTIFSKFVFFFSLVENSLLTVIDSSMNKKNSRENTADIKFQTFVYVNNARQT